MPQMRTRRSSPVLKVHARQTTSDRSSTGFLKPSTLSIENSRLLNQVHRELGYVWECPAKLSQALPQHSHIVTSCGAFSANSDQDHMPRHAKLVDRQPHEHPRRWHGDVHVELVRAGQAHRTPTRIAKP